MDQFIKETQVQSSPVSSFKIKSKRKKGSFRKSANIQNKMLPFIKTSHMFSEALEKGDQQAIWESMTPNAFWYLVNAQYFPDTFFPQEVRAEARK